MTNEQRELIEAMNEWCSHQCDLNASIDEINSYIEDNIDEYLQLTASEYMIENGYF